MFFCHRNPIDPAAGFDPAHGQVTGTEDVLLFRDIVETVVAQAFRHTEAVNLDAAELAKNLHAIRLLDGHFGFDPAGFPLFDEHGKRNSGTGEHVVYLRPIGEGDLVLATAQVEVWTRDAAPGMRPTWRLVGAFTIPDPQTELEQGTQP